MSRSVEPFFRFRAFLVLGILLGPSHMFAQDNARISSQTGGVTITASSQGSDLVRITAPTSIVQMRVEIYSAAGQKVWDSDIRGNVFDWHVQDGQAHRLAAAEYSCVVTIKSISGKISQKIGSIIVSDEDVNARIADLTQLTPQQSQAIGPLEESSSWIVLNSTDNQTTTVVAHDGTDAQIVRGRGAFSFRLGDFFAGKDIEQMRLTEEGNLGLGTSKPKFKLDVAGVIRARGGFVFNDGSMLNVNEKGLLTRTAADGSITPTAAGTGTQGRLAKWTDNAGTLGDSIITETGGGFLGIGTGSPDSLINVQGTIPSLLGKMAVIRTTGSNNGFGLQLDAIGSGNNNLGLAVNGVPKAGFSWDNARKFIGFVNYAYSPNDFSLRVNVDGSLTYHDGLNSAELFRITKTGNVGIGTFSPTTRLDVVHPASQIRFGPSAADNGGYLLSTNASQAIIAGGASWNGTNWIAKDNVASLTANQLGVIAFHTNTGLTAGNPFAPAERMRIDVNGNVGIGTQAPTLGKLQVEDSTVGTAVYGLDSRPCQIFESGCSAGVMGETTNGNGWGVYGKNGFGGFAMFAEGHAGQSRNKGGWVKAMLYVNANGTIARCYNGITGSVGGSCGFTVTHDDNTGYYQIDFGFQVSDRFISITPDYTGIGMVANSGGFPSANVLGVLNRTVKDTPNSPDNSFTVIVY